MCLPHGGHSQCHCWPSVLILPCVASFPPPSSPELSRECLGPQGTTSPCGGLEMRPLCKFPPLWGRRWGCLSWALTGLDGLMLFLNIHPVTLTFLSF